MNASPGILLSSLATRCPCAYRIPLAENAVIVSGIILMQSRYSLLPKFARTSVAFLCVALLGACQPPNHYLIHPELAPAGVVSWNEEIRQGELWIRLRWARPEGTGRFPTVLVHPEAGKQAAGMQGVIWAHA